MSKNLVIAIDGPAGSGKSTIAKYLAQKLKAVYVDTGAMYRAITYLALRNNIEENTPEVIALVRTLNIELKFENGITRVFVNEEEVTDNIRTKAVNDKVSDISRIPEVREELVKIQKKLGENQTIVAEGRDTTTVVFPDADFKIYLTADLDVRAERRFKEFLENDTEIDLESVKLNLADRDRIDSSRKVSPLKKAEDAFEVDSTSLTIKEELDMLLEKIKDLKKTEPQ